MRRVSIPAVFYDVVLAKQVSKSRVSFLEIRLFSVMEAILPLYQSLRSVDHILDAGNELRHRPLARHRSSPHQPVHGRPHHLSPTQGFQNYPTLSMR
jgi:hypothetical protein